ncbi:hypothetical protein EYB53_011920 [Candidatus Chloroploca sp. M-50]|uniref:Uncharacterized protein n=1 Tax=Candidatus Chloroploca mongolica TaxID=2528176 RepID=A0ABS4DAD7_9CHLR|nr:hypothetical protein [Candidatus Chloroploca mongolica]MBP1466411.1 hypothetical protein [Candidatus Chloroploca mongolica]
MFDWLFGSRKQDQRHDQGVLQGTPATVEPITLRVSLITHAPILEARGGQRLYEHFKWPNPLALAQQYAADLRTVSGGIARYDIVEHQVVDGYPVKRDGFVYDDATYLRCMAHQQSFHQPDAVDYERLIATFDLKRKVLSGAIDEVWLMGFPYAGYYESQMVGAGAIWCNSPPLASPDLCPRRFIIMGFNYERGVDCMLENFGHRVESIMSHVYRNHQGERNLWERYIRHEVRHPGRAECGNVHFAPNSTRDYEWGNARPVLSRADTWYNFPDLSGAPRMMNAQDWGNGDMRLHHLWWLDHLPRVAGATDGVQHNWWWYVLCPDRAF